MEKYSTQDKLSDSASHVLCEARPTRVLKAVLSWDAFDVILGVTQLKAQFISLSDYVDKGSKWVRVLSDTLSSADIGFFLTAEEAALCS